MVFIVLPNLLVVFYIYIYTFEKSFMIYLSVLNKLSINQSINQYICTLLYISL